MTSAFKVQVLADNSGKWVGNGLEFLSLDAAKQYGADLFMRWTAVIDWRVIDVNDNEFYRWGAQ